MRKLDKLSSATFELFMRLNVLEACVLPFCGACRGRRFLQANPPPEDFLGGGSEVVPSADLEAELNEAERTAVAAYQVYLWFGLQGWG